MHGLDVCRKGQIIILLVNNCISHLQISEHFHINFLPQSTQLKEKDRINKPILQMKRLRQKCLGSHCALSLTVGKQGSYSDSLSAQHPLTLTKQEGLLCIFYFRTMNQGTLALLPCLLAFSWFFFFLQTMG